MENTDIRWIQRFNNFNKAFAQLENAVEKGDYSELERQGLIKAFEFTYELAWNTLKDFLVEGGYVDLVGSKDTIRLAYKVGLIEDGDNWMNMIKSRNLSSHTYNKETAEEIQDSIQNTYYFLFKVFQERMQTEIDTTN
ncbi:nucleotidyltransferase substrate binding protein [Arcicella lustrica]|uniref:Nucleotidyltransferase substrate binding protein n=1 Tax=Arcicella lustrica TaxID=2984196 RepID=A0ABU5SJT1_9BACT|nr:nucleotidyltransferase substrate binding protein [Arcicella sp. DC25W]MEA5427548.1 nucleotidyltransferase substrate binding protein [Arcicella sp. DC25W]